MAAQQHIPHDHQPKGPSPLGEKFAFPSDHFPIAANVQLNNHQVTVASWNVLSSHCLHQIEEREIHVLHGSQVTSEHRIGLLEHQTSPRVRDHVTERDLLVLAKINELFRNGVSLLSLQECSPPFCKLLARPGAFESPNLERIVSGGGDPAVAGMIVYDPSALSTDPKNCFEHPLGGGSRYVLGANFTTPSGERFSFLTTHLPGRGDLIEILAELSKVLENEKLLPMKVLTGDFNRSPSDVLHSLRERDQG
ncbi:MAG: hypothetical protein KDD64_08735, partial [Bdellovibrionales bacterium]|nr:hypothetical protein [Bdellovibrionales bacterium]